MFTWLNGSDTTPPAFLHFRSSKFFIIGSISAAVFTDLFLYGVVVPVLPFALHNRANVADDEVQKWVSILLAVYGAALFVACPFCGWFADQTTSRKMPLLLGLVALAGATAILTAGNSISVLIAGRGLQGFSAAVVWCVGLALVADTVGPAGVGEAMGYLAIAMSVGTVIAPLVGGVVFERAGYYAVFGVSFALLGVDIVLRLALIETCVAKKWLAEKDATEDALPALEGRELTKSDGDSVGPSTPTTPMKPAFDRNVSANALPKGPAGLAVTALPALASDLTTSTTDITKDTPETKPKRRLPPFLYLLKSRRLLSSCMGCLIQSILLTSFDSTVPLFVHRTFHWDSIGAGLVFLPIAIPVFFAPIIGIMSDRYGPRWLCAGGFLATAPMEILLRLITHDSIGQKVLFCALLFILGLTLTFALTPIMAEVTYCVEAMAEKSPPGTFGKNGAMAQAYGLFNMAFAAGSMAGPLMSGLLVQNAGWPTATLVLGLLSAVWTLPTLYWTGGSLRKHLLKKKEKSKATDEIIL